MKDKLPGTGDLQTDSCPLPALPCLPAPPACPGIFTGSSLNILHPRHLSLAAQCSRLIQPGSPTLSSWSLVCNIDIRCVHGNTLMPPPWHLLGAAPGSCSLTCWDPLGLKVTSLTNWRRKNFPALPNVLSSANLLCQPRWDGKRSSQIPFAIWKLGGVNCFWSVQIIPLAILGRFLYPFLPC